MLEQFDSFITKYSREFSVPVAWIKAFIMTESSGRPNAIGSDPDPNDKGYGLMQVIPRTARSLGYTGEISGLLDPETSIRLGTKLIGQLRSALGDDIRRVYSAYNSGGADNYLTNPQVAKNVNRMIGFLESVLESEPFIVSAGAVGAILVAILVWYWSKKKK